MREEVATRYPSALTPWDFLGRAGLWIDGSLTRAGILLFAEEQKKLLVPASVVKCTRYLGVDRSASRDVVDFEGTITNQIRSARQFVADRVRFGEIPTADSAELSVVYDLPMVAVREIIANALVHRDYATPEACVHVRLYLDRLEVVSPGNWLGHRLTDGEEQELAELEGQSIKRNFRLSQILSWAKLVEGEGSGIPTAVENCRNAHFEIPTVVQNQGLVTVTLRRKQLVSAGGMANSGVIYLHSREARSRYIEQVRRIAPPKLVDRQRELDELADFCTSATAGSYQWWRAEAWSGKSALMSWFALHPPDGVRILPFFITARLSSQNERSAFVENVLEQLFALVDQGMPPILVESTREAHLLSLLNEAAEVCKIRGERFVVLVDGLDEDRSGSDTSSIAALLPAHIPDNMRVIVASRPHPPLPIDVPEHHPLRDPAIVRELEPSGWARAVRSDMERELKGLIHGSPVEKDLLGLTAASGGGLTAADLAELTELSPWEVHDYLRTAAGRTFSRRDSHYRPGVAPDVYVLGHEELQVTACDMLGPARLDDYRQRLHSWAEHYREEGWPANTPEYLLHDYYYMLTSTGDLRRMITYATDTARQDRMLDFSGGGAAALAEISVALELEMAQNPPDLSALLSLAIHRDHLRGRNTNIPIHLPALWASLKQSTRAVTLARSLATASRQSRALVAVAQVLAADGEFGRANELLDQVDILVRSVLPRRSLPASMMVRARAAAGEPEQVEGLALSMGNPARRSRALIEVAQAWSVAGEPDRADAAFDRAEKAVRRIAVPGQHCQVLTSLAQARAALGQHERANALLDEAEALAETLAEIDQQCQALMAMAQVRAEVGERHRAEELARSISIPRWQCQALASVAKAWAAAGERGRATSVLNRAEKLARTINTSVQRSKVLLAVAEAWSTAGQRGRAVGLLDEVEASARSWGDAYSQRRVMISVAQAWSTVGEPRRAVGLLDEIEALARSITATDSRHQALRSLARALAAIGESDRATAVLDHVEKLARTTINPTQHDNVLLSMVRALAGAGEFDRAETLAQSIGGDNDRNKALLSMVRALIGAGEVDRAHTLAQLITYSIQPGSVRLSMVRALAGAGEFDQARTLTRSIADEDHRSKALLAVAQAMATAGVVDQAESVARSIPRRPQQSRALRSMVKVLAAAGEPERAEELARSFAGADEQLRALTSVAHELAVAGDSQRSKALLDEVVARSSDDLRQYSISFVLSLAKVLAVVGEPERAEELARSLAGADEQVRALTSVAYELASAGDVRRAVAVIGRAEKVVRSVTQPYKQIRAFVSIARALAAADETVWAAVVIGRAENLVRSVAHTYKQIRALALIARALVAIGEYERARNLILSIDHYDQQSRAWVWLATCSDQSQSEYAIARMLTLDCWDLALEALVHTKPEVLTTATDTLAAVMQRGGTVHLLQ